MAISKTTDTTIIAEHQINNKTEITQTNNLADIVTEQIINPGIGKLVLIADDLNIYLAQAEHHDKIKTIDNKNRMLTKTRKISIKTVTQVLPRKKRL